MIVKDKNLSFFKLLCEMRGSIVPTILPQIVFAAFLGVLAKLILMFNLFGSNTKDVMYMEFSPFAALGVAISLFLGFHNNSSYARWWEARIYWGTLVIAVRDLVRFLAASVETDGDEGSCGATISSMISSENEDNDVERAVKTLTGEGFSLSKSKHYDSNNVRKNQKIIVIIEVKGERFVININLDSKRIVQFPNFQKLINHTTQQIILLLLTFPQKINNGSS